MPQSHYKPYPTFLDYLKENYQGPYSATDILIRHNDGLKKGLVLIERKNTPYGFAIPGGMAEFMTFEDNCIKEGYEETGLVVVLDSPNRPFCAFSTPTQDPRAFIASVVYTARGFGTLKPREDEDAKTAKVFTLDEIARLLNTPKVFAFPDHHVKILKLYLQEAGRFVDYGR